MMVKFVLYELNVQRSVELLTILEGVGNRIEYVKWTTTGSR